MRPEQTISVYVLASCKNGTLYVGVTNNLKQRVWQHKTKVNKGFTSEYNVLQLVYYENYGEIGQALYREKQIKKWKRAWKIALIEKDNVRWNDLFDSL